MTDYTFKVNLDGLTELECFSDASRDELKVLLTVISLGGASVSTETLAQMSGVSKARVLAALALFEESGVITKRDPFLAEVEYEFEPRKDEEKLDDAKSTAKKVHNSKIHDVIVELEKMFEKTLSTTEMQRLSSLVEDNDLSAHYVLTLAAFLKDSYKAFTVNRVVTEAKKLIDKNICDSEKLEQYIIEKSKEVAGEAKMRILLGISGRTLTASERAYFQKWLHEFGYSELIIGEAYDITVNATSKRSLAYMDKILSAWHEAGCKTLEECRAKVAIRKQEGKKATGERKSNKTQEADTPKFADFNSEDALMRALERSYGDSDSN